MTRILILFVLFSTSSYSQENFRYHFSISEHSIVNWGSKEYSNVAKEEDGITFYENESYDIRYKKNNFSPGVSVGFGCNWYISPNLLLRNNISLFTNSTNEEIYFKITDIGNGDTTGFTQYDKSEVKLGSYGTVLSNDKSVGAKVEALLLYRFERINLGLGINYMKRYSGDQFMYSHRYNPWSYGRGRKAYSTDQLAAAFHFEYDFGRLTLFLNYAQQIITLKKEKGASYFDEGRELYPFSHNFDFRFPSMISLGLALNFDKINSK